MKEIQCKKKSGVIFQINATKQGTTVKFTFDIPSLVIFLMSLARPSPFCSSSGRWHFSDVPVWRGVFVERNWKSVFYNPSAENSTLNILLKHDWRDERNTVVGITLVVFSFIIVRCAISSVLPLCCPIFLFFYSN